MCLFACFHISAGKSFVLCDRLDVMFYTNVSVTEVQHLPFLVIRTYHDTVWISLYSRKPFDLTLILHKMHSEDK